MNTLNQKENYSLLNEEKKAKIMKDLREEIDKQKSNYSLNEDKINELKIKNLYNSNDINNLNLNSLINNEESTEKEEEEHYQILNNAQNVLNKIKDDINNLNQAYGIKNILPQNNTEKNNYLYNYEDSESSKSQESDEYDLNTEEEKNNNIDNINIENKDEQNNSNEENIEYEEEDYNENNYDDYNNENDSDNNNEFTDQYNIDDNTLYRKNSEENEEINQYNNYNNNINYSKYNFENPLGYDNDFMKNNIKNYSYDNKLNKESKNKNNIIKQKKNLNKKSFIATKKKSKTKKNTNDFNSKQNKNLNIDNILISKSKEKFDLMKKELEDKFAQDHPFKPKINSNYHPSKKISETEQERYNRLSKPKILEINEKKRKKDFEELKKISENNIIKPSHKINPKEVSNRLYNLSRELKLKKEKIKKSYDESQNKEYSFTPEINPFSKLLMNKYEQKPIYERNEDFEKYKTNNIIKKRQEIEKEQKERCKPYINPNSRKIALMQRNNDFNGDNDDVYERLYKENINKDSKNLGNRDLKECTFAPKVNPISDLLVSNNGQNMNYYNNENSDNMKDFLERQKMYEDLKIKNLEKNKEKNKEYTFKPEINSNSDLLVKCNPERLLEKNSDKYSRLYQDAERIKNKKEKLKNELDNKYNFTPKINELSKYIGRKPGFEEINIIQEKINKNEKIEEEYDFTPQINQNSKYKNIKSNYKNDQGILDRINEEMEIKNKKIENLQKIKENDDILKYNFTPEINKTMPDFENKNNKPMYMKGMARYLNQMEKARQAKRDKEQREKEVFITGENWNKNYGITVPKPFKLSYQNNLKKEKIRDNERINEENKENNYKMKNNENKNREIIKKLLNGN